MLLLLICLVSIPIIIFKLVPVQIHLYNVQSCICLWQSWIRAPARRILVCFRNLQNDWHQAHR